MSLSRRVRLAALAVLGVALASLACGGGGGGGGPTTPGPSLVFTPDGGGGAQSISLRRNAASTATRLVLDLTAEQVSGVYGLAFDLRYPASVLAFDLAREGDFLDGGGTVTTTLQLSEAPAGNLVVGLTRLGPTPGADGSGVLLQLEFRAVASGSGDLRFEGAQAFDPQGVALPALTWSGGRVQVVR